MKIATNEAEVIENFRELVEGVNKLYNEFFENSKAGKGYVPVIMDELEFERREKEGHKCWIETKENFQKIDFGLYFGLMTFRSYGAIALSPQE